MTRNNYQKKYYEKNRQKINAKNRAYYHNNKEKTRDRAFKYEYGITLEDYNKKFEQQRGNCAICGEYQSKFKKSLAVDHNHTTGQIRSLLCNNCNGGLGNFKDNIEFLLKAIEYLKGFE